MAKQSHSPSAAAMPKGQMFRQSVKRRKDDGTSNSDKTTARHQKEEGNPIKKMKKSEGPVKTPQKSILKKTAAPPNVNGKGKGKESESDIVHSTLPGKAHKNESKEKKVTSTQSKKVSKVSKPVKELPLPKTFRIIAGSYERLLYGFQVKIEAHGEVKAEPTFTPMFSFAAHTSCISAVAAAGIDSKWLATGAGDETVRVWDLRKKKEVGGLTGHGGTIHSLSFPSRTYLISSDSSGLINLYRTRDWALLKTLRGHTGRVNACQAHPSGKVALSVGQDGMLRMWDLMRGKGAGAVKLRLGMTEDGQEMPSRNVKEEPLDVQWSPDGSRFLVMGRTEVSVFSTDMIKIASVIVRRDDPKHKFGSAYWLNDHYVLCGTESGTVDIYHVGKDSLVGPICQLVGHENRVKSIRSIRLHPSASPKPINLVVTASSDGKIRIYDCSDLIALKSVKEKKTEEIEKREPMATHDTGGARLTCLDVVGGSGVRTGATDSKETDAEDESDEEDGDDDEAGFDLSEDDDLRITNAGEEMNESELQELNDLLDLLEEAKAQGLDVEGLSDFEGDEEDLYDDDDDDDGDDDEEEEGEEEEEEEEEEED